MQSVYMTPQGSTCNLLINAIKQAAITNNLDYNYRTDEMTTTSPTTTPYATTPSTPFGPFRQTLDLSNVSDQYLNIPKPSVNRNSISAAAVTAKIREYESLIRKASLDPIITELQKYFKAKEFQKDEITEVKNYSDQIVDSQKHDDTTTIEFSTTIESPTTIDSLTTTTTIESPETPKKYNHTVELSSGSNTFVADSYDHIDVDSITTSANSANSPIELVDKKNNFLKKATDDITVLDFKPEKWFTSLESNTDDFIKKDRLSLTLNIGSDQENSSTRTRDIVEEEGIRSTSRISRISKYSKFSYVTRGDTTSKSDSTTEVDGVDSPISPVSPISPISSRRISMKDAVIFSPVSSKRVSKDSYVIRDQEITIDLNSPGEDISWIITSFSLASTIIQPFYGKFFDIFGKRKIFLMAIFIFGLGSVLCGAAQNIQWLIGARALAGLGSGIIVTMTFNIISDIIPVSQRGPFNNLLFASFALGLILGPIYGGLFIDYISWRWSFYLNGPLSIASILVLWFILKFPVPSGSKSIKLKHVDWLGIFLLVSGFLLLIIPLNLGGNKFAWFSIPIIIMLSSGLLILITFVILELRSASDPIIPGFLFSDSCLRAIFGIFFFTGWIQVVICYFIPIYFQYVQKFSPITSAIFLLPLVTSIALSSGFGNELVIRFGNYRWLIYCGSIELIIGCALLTTYKVNTEETLQIISLMIIGFGIGSLSIILLKPAQASVKERERITVIRLCNFFRGSGWTIGMAISSALFNNKIITDISNIPNFPITNSLNDILLSENIKKLSQSDQNLILTSINNSITRNFEVCIFITTIVLVFSLFVKHYKLNKLGGLALTGITNVDVKILNEKI
ncbi:10704_t:CDS:2 [Diversispora eburnea]|uniref:10704_t:CDS:1 n=1 Tax=Diversispora eburnea TaxID=1213867 RepID=A0A9N8V0M7_9GLOM|nr:10704_t:CDS:2 [Diversispora eburnea]